jgi:hypothetical protein
MPVTVEPTPNPNALKFTVGKPVGGPATFIPGKDHDNPMASELLAISGITSVFMTADFVTLSKTPETDWAAIAPSATEIIERHLG